MTEFFICKGFGKGSVFALFYYLVSNILSKSKSIYFKNYIEILLHEHCSGCIEIANPEGQIFFIPRGEALPMFVQYYISSNQLFSHSFTSQCGDYGNLLSLIFGKNFVKVTFSLNPLCSRNFQNVKLRLGFVEI